MNSSKDVRHLIETLWLKMLRRPPGEVVADDENFIDMGGTSLDMIRLHSAIVRNLGDVITPTRTIEVLDRGDFASLADALSAAIHNPAPAEPSD